MPTIRSWVLERQYAPAAPAALTDFPDVLMRAPAETMLAFLDELGDVRALLTAHGLTDTDLANLRTVFPRA
ncbi:hypothetical protein AB0L25_09890 [Spirillospora sp. NPDC052242]